jgi:hypothetical protein
MSLFEVVLIAVGAWIVLLVVAHAVKAPQRRIDPHRRLGLRRWDDA